MPFTDWIRLVVSTRGESVGQGTKQQAIQQGIRESFDSGTWVLGEIATISPGDLEIAHAAYSPLHPNQLILPFLEQLGRDQTMFADKHDQLEKHFQRPEQHASPHAPYSTHPSLVKQMCDQATVAKRMVAMHLAETKAELELLNHRQGDFVEMLKGFGVWNPDSFSNNNLVPSLLRQLSSAGRSLVIHGNYLTDTEIKFLGTHRETMSVVYCPRTHRYFRHDPYPLESFQRQQVCVALGTDSRASNPDLNLFEELKTVALQFPDLSTDEVLKMGTLNGAQALGLLDDYGSLTAGKKAAISFVSAPKTETQEPPESWILRPDSVCKPVT